MAPYLAQGAAIAVEDAACLGRMLGLLVSHLPAQYWRRNVPTVLRMCEQLRGERARSAATAGTLMGMYNHLHDGGASNFRDGEMAAYGPDRPSPVPWVDARTQRDLLGHDAVSEAEKYFMDELRRAASPPRS